jgi:hypothetical protein
MRLAPRARVPSWPGDHASPLTEAEDTTAIRTTALLKYYLQEESRYGVRHERSGYVHGFSPMNSPKNQPPSSTLNDLNCVVSATR